MDKEVILLDGFGITANVLVPAGTVAVLLHGGDVKIVPAEQLRATVEKLGSEKIEGLSMAPSDFQKAQDVIERRTRASEPGQE